MAATTGVSAEQISAIRHFNRFYTRQIGLLNDGMLDTNFSLSEMRILYELAHGDNILASNLAHDLGLDAGYLSRILKKFETKKLLTRAASPEDARQQIIALTALGRKAYEPLNRASIKQISDLLSGRSRAQCAQLVRAMDNITEILDTDKNRRQGYVLRPPEPGDMGWVVRQQAALYAQEYGWDNRFEALISRIVADYITGFDPAFERCWIAERQGEMIGSIFCVKQSKRVAKLRLLYVDASARGMGIGERLVDEVIRFAQAKSYKSLTLWTNDILGAARRIYQAKGFVLVGEDTHHSFGKELTGQNWVLNLSEVPER